MSQCCFGFTRIWRRKLRASFSWAATFTCPETLLPLAEFNFWFDPEAAQAVLRSRIPEKVMFPLDICNRAVLNNARFAEIIAAKTPLTERYKEDYGMRYPGFLKNPNATGFLWDELAAAWLLDTGFVTKSETSWLDIDTRFGKTYWCYRAFGSQAGARCHAGEGDAGFGFRAPVEHL